MGSRHHGSILVTGGAGFIGSNLVRMLLREGAERVANLDDLSYAGSGGNLDDLKGDSRYGLYRGSVLDLAFVRSVLERERPWAALHLAAESHVDRSLRAAAAFLDTNVQGTRVMLDACRSAGWSIRFVFVSTDEVYGDLGPDEPPFSERTPLCPSSPYAVSKAAGDMLCRAYHRTYDMDVVITRCSNNYGPFQFPEKLLPLTLTNAIDNEPVPLYGDGAQVRDWIHVDDHCHGLLAALQRGRAGRAYNFGGREEHRNLDLVRACLAALGKPESLIRFVSDRPGHDRRYAMNVDHAEAELGWSPRMRFDDGLERTVRWYRDNERWWRRLKDASFEAYYREQYADLAAERGAP